MMSFQSLFVSAGRFWTVPRIALLFLPLFSLLLTSAASADRINMIDGRGRAVTGTILLINEEKITVSVRNNQQDIPANIIASTVFDGEPSQLGAARVAFIGSRMSEALELLKSVDPKELTKQGPKQDYEYFKAAAKARMVLAGEGPASMAAEAEKELADFIRTNRNSYHFYDVCELYGDLMVAMEQADKAKNAYAALAKAPWPEYNLMATVGLGMAELRENKIAEARANFEKIAQSTEDSEQAARPKGLARVGLALCLAAENKTDEAIAALEKIAAETSGEDSGFLARLYNSLGMVYSQAGKPQNAIIAYMHTDLLFATARNEHIAALKALSKLWRDSNREDRAQAVDQQLKTRYNIGTN